MKVKQILTLALAACTGGLAWAEDAYIETDGTQAFVLDYYASGSTKVVADFAWVDTETRQQRLFGPMGDDARLAMGSYINTSGNYAWSMQDDTANRRDTGVAVTTDRVKLAINSSGDEWGRAAALLCTPTKGNAHYVYLDTTHTKKAVIPLTIAADQTLSGLANFGKLKIFSFSIYDGEALVRHLLPYSDGEVVGLYDTVTKKVYTSAVGNAPRYVASTETQPRLRIMPLGDSITEGVGGDGGGGYRLPLFQQLTSAGYRVQMVGNHMARPSTDLPEPFHEGHSGWTIGGIHQHMVAWLEGVDDPDVVLMHIGTNDSGAADFNNRIDALDSLITTIVETRPMTHIVVTTLLPRSDATLDAKIQEQFNPFVQPLVERHQAQGHRVHFFDMHARLSCERPENGGDMNDGLHPNKDGYVKMAAAYAEPVQAIFGLNGDALDPAIARVAASEDGRHVQVNFSKALTPAAATATWTVPGATVAHVSLMDDGRLAVLKLAEPLAPGDYTVQVAGVAAATAPETPFNLEGTFSVPEPFDYESTVPESERKDYTLIYSTELPVSAQFDVPGAFAYEVDNSNASIGFDRVAYYLQLETLSGERQWVWVSMDAFTDDLSKIGIPTFASRIVFKKNVANMNVWSNVAGVDTGTGIAGGIEFWPYNYQKKGNAFGVDDTMSGDGTYGSMQVHNMDAGKTVFAFNHYGETNFKPCLGIGNSPEFAPNGQAAFDWTFHENADTYRVRNLKVFARLVPDTAAPTAAGAKVGSAGTQIFVEFSEKIDELSLLPTCFTGVEVTGMSLLRDGRTVSLRTLPTEPGATLTVAGVKDLSGNASAPQDLVVEAFGLPSDLVQRVGAGDLADYELVYALDIPAVGNFNATSQMYWYDQSEASAPVDRVAYYFELEDLRGRVTYAFTAFDAPSAARNGLGVPLGAKAGIMFDRKVSNAYVKTNVGNIPTGDIGNECAIEFWSCSYGKTDRMGWGASNDHYDWGDDISQWPYENGYGCMQVHNTASGTTIWALNNFGTDGGKLCVGIGNSNNLPNHGDCRDWTFAENAANYLSRKLYVLVRPKQDVDGDQALVNALTDEAIAKVGVDALAGYRLVAAVTDIPAQTYVSDEAWAAANFYAFDHTTTVRGFDRVAYFVQYKDDGDAEPRWIYTAMDAFTPSARRLRAPTPGYFFQQKVANLTVKSNVGGIVEGDNLDTGVIEFAPSNYSERRGVDTWDDDDGKFGWNDSGFGTGKGHGCWQVHNVGAHQTLWALNNFNNGTAAGFGIGNESTTGNYDWTFSSLGPRYTDVRILVFVHETADAETAARREVEDRVGAETLDGYEMLFAISSVPEKCKVNERGWDTANLYAVDKRYAYEAGSFDRVAYFMEVQYNDEDSPRYVWVEMDPFTPKAYQLGVPFGGYTFQQLATNMDVLSNDPHVTPGKGITTGVVEFWASDYRKERGSNDWNDDGNTFGWNDSGFGTGQGHASMQIHNAGTHEVLMSFGHYNRDNKPYVGVGANQRGDGSDPDYTFTYNADQYQRIRIVGFVRPTATRAAKPGPAATRAVAAAARTGIAVRFDAPLAPYAAAGTFTLSDGAKVTGAVRVNETWLVLDTTPLAAGRTYGLTCTVAGADGGTRETTIDVVVPADGDRVMPACAAGVPEAGDYRVAYRIDLPEIRNQLYQDTPYAVDEEFFYNGAFDRVAYCLELTDKNGVAKWVWVSMDAFTDNLFNVAIPTVERGRLFQQKVGHMNVYASANSGVVTGTDIATGNIEFWPSNYQEGTALGDIGGDGAAFDWDDKGGSVGYGYGSMQIHNWGARQTVMAVNSFGANNGDKVCVGIGPNNSGTGSPDWTHAYNASDFVKRRLWVFVRETAPMPQGKGPVVLLPPAAQRVPFGESFTLFVKAAGEVTGYQWYRNGQVLSGATSATLTVAEAVKTDEGDYTVLVKGAYGTTVTAPAFVDVLELGSLILFR